jgi:hypothetical protein
MTTPILSWFVKAGIMTPNNLGEIERWGCIVSFQRDPAESYQPDITHGAFIEAIEHSVSDQTFKEVDLNLVGYYERTLREVHLHLEQDNEVLDTSIYIGTYPTGDFILPGLDPALAALLDNGVSYIEEDGFRYFFNDCRELYCNSTCFLVCRPSTKEPINGHK